MGHVKIDTEKQSRKYTETYSLSTAAGVKRLLRDRHRIAARRFKGDTAASDILIDLHSAINSAGLTDRQTEAVAWVYGADVTQAKAAEIMGITQQNVGDYVETAAVKIAVVYKRWEYGDVKIDHDEAIVEGDAA
ncbi:sigma factor-like helix-turn-helix DNA-binding protein [Paenibacillus sp. CAU 1782]